MPPTFALRHGSGLRRAEAASLDVGDYEWSVTRLLSQILYFYR
jgi:hypothetical protein